MKVNYSQGTWSVWALINLFTVVIGILFFWLFGFLESGESSTSDHLLFSIQPAASAARAGFYLSQNLVKDL